MIIICANYCASGSRTNAAATTALDRRRRFDNESSKELEDEVDFIYEENE